ncbi:MAG: AraC family transcriptional regulator [Eubacteriales bacterium]|nr:AraC family transcriptional regulator [Eubacteriales bacterium]
MDREILARLSKITAEEQSILDGRTTIDRGLYMQGRSSIVNAKKLLASGKLITIRPHTRFIHFPEHTHDYVEVVYMCAGRTRHIVSGRQIELAQGDLLFLSQSCTHEVCRAEKQDIAVNFIVLPDFFNAPLAAMEEETPLRRFLVDCLCRQNSGPGYLHFDVSGVKPIENLIENLLWTLLEETPNKRKMSQMTMALLFLQLTGRAETLVPGDQEDAAVIQVLRCIESDYAGCSFGKISAQLHYDPSWLSRKIKAATGKTFTQLVQEKRLAQAAFLLKNTNRNVSDISVAVGYENISYFHRIFAAAFGKSPRRYRNDG